MRKAIIKTAGNMSEETYERLCSGFSNAKGGNIEFSHVVDESVIGGFIVDFDGMIYDYSVATQLRKLKQHIDN